MKKFLPLMALAIVMLFGCAKEETTPQMEEVGTFILGEPGTSSLDLRENQGNSAHMHGDYGPSISGITGVFSGTQNNGGAHGSATLTDPAGRTYTLETECVMVEGNEAVYGGIVTTVGGPPPAPIGNFPKVGDRLYFKVIDNGQGNNAPADQFHITIRISRTGSACGVWTPGSDVWPELVFGFFPGYNDIPEPGSVQVNN